MSFVEVGVVLATTYEVEVMTVSPDVVTNGVDEGVKPGVEEDDDWVDDVADVVVVVEGEDVGEVDVVPLDVVVVGAAVVVVGVADVVAGFADGLASDDD